MNLESWKSQAMRHWKEFQPTRYRELVRSGKLQAALDEAAQQTYLEMNALTEQVFQEHEAWEMVRETYLFPPEEALEGETDISLWRARPAPKPPLHRNQSLGKALGLR